MAPESSRVASTDRKLQCLDPNKKERRSGQGRGNEMDADDAGPLRHRTNKLTSRSARLSADMMVMIKYSKVFLSNG